jgi:hypothetical protein
MQLHRVTVDAFDNYPVGGKYLGQSVDYLEIRPPQLHGDPSTLTVVACFNRFGAGAHRKSDYEVLSDWQDIEAIIAKFCEAGHPAAIELDRARQLAKAVKAAGWTEPKS